MLLAGNRKGARRPGGAEGCMKALGFLKFSKTKAGMESIASESVMGIVHPLGPSRPSR